MGALAAGVTALLLAPYSGRTKRELLRTKGKAWKARADHSMTEQLNRVEYTLGQVRDTLERISRNGRELTETVKAPASLAGKTVEKALSRLVESCRQDGQHGIVEYLRC